MVTIGRATRAVCSSLANGPPGKCPLPAHRGSVQGSTCVCWLLLSASGHFFAFYFLFVCKVCGYKRFLLLCSCLFFKKQFFFSLASWTELGLILLWLRMTEGKMKSDLSGGIHYKHSLVRFELKKWKHV